MTSLRRAKIEDLWLGRIAFSRRPKLRNRDQRERRRIRTHLRRTSQDRQALLRSIVTTNLFEQHLRKALRSIEQES